MATQTLNMATNHFLIWLAYSNQGTFNFDKVVASYSSTVEYFLNPWASVFNRDIP